MSVRRKPFGIKENPLLSAWPVPGRVKQVFTRAMGNVSESSGLGGRREWGDGTGLAVAIPNGEGSGQEGEVSGQWIAVGVIVFLSAAYLGFFLWRKVRAGKRAGNPGCGGCAGCRGGKAKGGGDA